MPIKDFRKERLNRLKESVNFKEEYLMAWDDYDLTKESLMDAITRTDADINTGAHLFVITLNKKSLVESLEAANILSRNFDNILIRVDIFKESENIDEWTLKHIESGITFYSPGACIRHER